MIKPVLHPTVIFRVPRFSYQQSMAENWDALKECIKTSSPEFFGIVATMSFAELMNSDPKIQLTARKYYIRATYRSTPFAHFSGVGVTSMSWNNSAAIILKDSFKIHSYADWSVRPAMHIPLKKQIDCNVLFFANTTFYIVGAEIRFIQKSGSDFHISAVKFDKTIINILDSCTSPRSFEELSGLLNINPKMLIEYLEDLLDIQLLITSNHVNIIGQDFFSRMGLQTAKDNKQYLISESNSLSGQLDQKNFRHLPELVLKMQQILEVGENNELSEFKNRFIKKFELAEIPLMIALDPEAGVGYGDMQSHMDENRIIELLPQTNIKDNPAVNGNFKDVIYKLIVEKTLNKGHIDLEEINTKEPTREVLLPNSIQAICVPVDDEIMLQSLGGITANALLGRFAGSIRPIYEHCKEVASLEQDSNPCVLFFDVGYTKEDRVDNINRRPSFYDYQFNILNYDTSDVPLCANDLFISVQQGEVILRSRSLDKRVVPRFASAYNYRRSDLPLFRLLMDIQSQGFQGNLLFRPSEYVSGLSFYPRIQFKNIIVAPAIWLLKQDLLMGTESWEDKYEKLLRYLAANVSCRYIKAGKSDMMLFLDIHQKQDVSILLSLLGQEQEVYIEEAYLPKKAAFYNSGNQPLLPQLIITLTHKNQIAGALPSIITQSYKLEKKQWVAPGKDWLYFEIYGTPVHADELLTTKISKYLQLHKASFLKWFFIRYNENGDHIRLRLQLKDPSNGYDIVNRLTALLSDDLETGKVNDIRLCTYKKEVHRYSGQLMQKVEGHFHKDSIFVLNMLKNMLPDFAKYRLSMAILDHVYESQVIATKDINVIIKIVSGGLKSEHRLNKESLKKINLMYKDFVRQPVPDLSKNALRLHLDLQKSMVGILDICPVHDRPKLLVDLMHMHINRLFNANQRLHEFVIYELYRMDRKKRFFLQQKSAMIF